MGGAREGNQGGLSGNRSVLIIIRGAHQVSEAFAFFAAGNDADACCPPPRFFSSAAAARIGDWLDGAAAERPRSPPAAAPAGLGPLHTSIWANTAGDTPCHGRFARPFPTLDKSAARLSPGVNWVFHEGAILIVIRSLSPRTLSSSRGGRDFIVVSRIPPKTCFRL